MKLLAIRNPFINYSSSTSGVVFFNELLRSLISFGFVIGVVIFMFNLIIGAIKWITAGGDKASLEAARSKVENAIIGLFILLSLFAIANVLEIFFNIDLLILNIQSLRDLLS